MAIKLPQGMPPVNQRTRCYAKDCGVQEINGSVVALRVDNNTSSGMLCSVQFNWYTYRQEMVVSRKLCLCGPS